MYLAVSFGEVQKKDKSTSVILSSSLLKPAAMYFSLSFCSYQSCLFIVLFRFADEARERGRGGTIVLLTTFLCVCFLSCCRPLLFLLSRPTYHYLILTLFLCLEPNHTFLRGPELKISALVSIVLFSPLELRLTNIITTTTYLPTTITTRRLHGVGLLSLPRITLVGHHTRCFVSLSFFFGLAWMETGVGGEGGGGGSMGLVILYLPLPILPMLLLVGRAGALAGWLACSDVGGKCNHQWIPN